MDLVMVAAARPLLDDVAGLGEIVDDATDAAFGNADSYGDVIQAHLGIACDTGEDSGMVAPFGHAAILVDLFMQWITCVE